MTGLGDNEQTPALPEAPVHELKTWPDYWLAIETGAKTFEVRRNDRGFQPGDTLLLREWNPFSEEYTGRFARRRVTYVLRDAVRFGLREGFVVLGLAHSCDRCGDPLGYVMCDACEVAAGRTVLELPQPTEQNPAMWEAVAGATPANPYWRVDPDLDEYGPWVRCQLGHHYLDPANAAQLGAALIACARESERLASESSGDGETDAE